MVTPTQWVEAVRSYVGTPYRHMGGNRHGVDCFGLLLAAARDCGIMVSDAETIVGYSSLPNVDMLKDEMPKYLLPRPYNRLQPLKDQLTLGDLIVVNIEGRRTGRHICVYSGVNEYDFDMIIHADAGGRRIVEEVPIMPGKWATKIDTVWYHPEIKEG